MVRAALWLHHLAGTYLRKVSWNKLGKWLWGAFRALADSLVIGSDAEGSPCDDVYFLGAVPLPSMSCWGDASG